MKSDDRFRGIVVFAACVLSCTGNNGGGAASSSSSGSTITTFQEYCQATAGAWACNPPPCDLGEPPADSDCSAVMAEMCATEAAHHAVLVDAGLVVDDLSQAAACAAAYRAYYSAFNEVRCDPTRQLEDLDYGTLDCAGGVHALVAPLLEPFLPGGACNRMTAGKVPVGGACGESAVCSAGLCMDYSDGGCGTCMDAGRPARWLAENATCVRYDAGSYRWVGSCDSALACDHPGTGRCLRTRGPGESCGSGIGQCSLVCGYSCEIVDGGAHACVAAPGVGARCTPATPCALETTCAFNLGDGGSYQRGVCVADAPENAPCEPDAINMNSFPAYYAFASNQPRSAFSSTGLPACAAGLWCVPVDGGARCRSRQVPGAGDWCADRFPAASCTDPALRCRPVDGGSRCLPLGEAGDSCGGYGDCRSTLFCDRATDTCRPEVPRGATCVDSLACQPADSCVDGTCQAREAVQRSVCL